MKSFASGGFRLRDAPRSLRLIYAGFLVVTAVGLLTQLGFQTERIGWTPAAIATYYRGGETGDTMAFPKPFGHLVEVSHAHAFMMGVVFLVLAHLFAGSPLLGGAVKGAVILTAFLGVVGDVGAPWLIRYVAAGFAWLQLAAWLALWLAGLGMLGVSLWECLGAR